MIQDDPNQPGYGAPMPEGYGDYESQYTQQRASYGSVPQGMLMGGYTVGAGAMSGMHNMMADVGRMVRPVSYTPPARMVAGYGGMYAQQGGMLSGMARYAGFGATPRGVSEYEHDYYNSSDLGERVGGGAMSAATTGAALALAPLLNPAGRAVGAFAGSALGPWGAAAGGAAGGLILPYSAAMWAAGQVQESVAQRREIQGFLENSSFRFAGSGFGQADPRFGAGMNVQARQQVADTIKQMGTHDPSMGTEELTSIMQQSTQLGLFSGTKDVKEFQTKFKDIVESVKVVTKTLHQTLEEGLRTIKDLRAIGIDPSEAKTIALEADAKGKMAGRTGVEMMQAGMQGAEMFRGTGISMRIGYEANIMGLSAIRAARDAGELSQEAIAQAGGEEALAQRATATGLGFAQSAMGRGYAASFYQGGKFNAGGFAASIGGEGDLASTTLRSAQNLADPRNLIAYQAKQSKYLSEMGGQFGGQGLQFQAMSAMMKQAQMLVSTGAAGTTEDAFHYVAQQAGWDESTIALNMGRMKNAPAEFQSAQNANMATRNKMVYEQAAMNSPLYRFGTKVGQFIERQADWVAKPLSEGIDTVKEGIVNFKEENWYGIQSVKVSDQMTSFSTPDAYFDKSGKPSGPLNLSTGGGILNDSAGQALARRIVSGDARMASGEKIGRRGMVWQAGAEDVILDTNRGDWGDDKRLSGGYGSDMLISKKELDAFERESKRLLDIDAQSKDAKSGITDAMRDTARKGTLSAIHLVDSGDSSLDAVVKTLTGKTTENMTAADWAVVREVGTEYKAIGNVVDKALDGAKGGEAISLQTYTKTVKDAQEGMADQLYRMTNTAGLDEATRRAVGQPLAEYETNRRKAKRLRAQGKTAEAKTAEEAAEAAKGVAELTMSAHGVVDKDARARVFAAPGMYMSDEQVYEVQKGFLDIQEAQTKLGTGIVADIVRGKDFARLSDTEKATANSFLESYRANPLLAFTDADKDTLGILAKTGGVGGALAKKADAAKKLLDPATTPEQAKELLTAFPNASQEMKDRIISAPQGEAGRAKDLSSMVQSDLVKATGVGDVKSSGDTSGVGSTAETAARTQTEINMQVLQGLTALSAQLLGKR